jgi:hypothetical protein
VPCPCPIRHHHHLRCPPRSPSSSTSPQGSLRRRTHRRTTPTSLLFPIAIVSKSSRTAALISILSPPRVWRRKQNYASTASLGAARRLVSTCVFIPCEVKSDRVRHGRDYVRDGHGYSFSAMRHNKRTIFFTYVWQEGNIYFFGMGISVQKKCLKKPNHGTLTSFIIRYRIIDVHFLVDLDKKCVDDLGNLV